MGERAVEPIAKALEALMAERGLSQTDLWAAANVSPAVVSSYLSGRRGTALDDRGAVTVRRLARVLEVPAEFFAEYRVWRLGRLARLDIQAADVAYDAAMELARLGGSFARLLAIEAELDEGG